MMAFGGMLGLIGIPVPGVEVGIALSAVILGALILGEARLPLAGAILVVAFFAIFHGYAHGAEMPSVAQPVTYALGFMSGTALLHLAGVVIGDISQHYVRGKLILRGAGVAIAGVGGMFLIGA